MRYPIVMMVALLASLGPSDGGAIPPPEDAAVRIGTFDRTGLLVAYYRSTIHAGHLKSLREEYEQAKATGETDRAAALQAKGAAEQELAHKQLAGEASIDGILGHLQASLPAIAQEARVQAIVEKPLYADERVVTVDVTELLARRFPAGR